MDVVDPDWENYTALSPEVHATASCRSQSARYSLMSYLSARYSLMLYMWYTVQLATATTPSSSFYVCDHRIHN